LTALPGNRRFGAVAPGTILVAAGGLLFAGGFLFPVWTNPDRTAAAGCAARGAVQPRQTRDNPIYKYRRYRQVRASRIDKQDVGAAI